MKKIIYLFLLICFSVSSNGQCVLDTFLFTKINCYQDTGLIKVFYDTSASTPVVYEWYHVSDTSFTNTLSTNKDLKSDTCGGFKLIVFDITGMPCDTSPPLFLGCPLDVTKGQTNIQCFGDSLGELRRRAYGGEPPYRYKWYKADDSLGTNSILLLDTILLAGDTSKLLNIGAGWYETIVTDDTSCGTSTGFIELKNPQPLLFHKVSFDSISCHGVATELEIHVKGGKKYTSGIGYSYYLIQNNDTIANSQSPTFVSIVDTLPPAIPDIIKFEDVYASIDSLLIRVVDSFGCPIDTTIFIDQPDSIVANINIPTNTLICTYDSAQISLDLIVGGTLPYNYFWNNDTTLTDSSIYVNGGFNRLYIIDSNGCKDSTNGVEIASYQDFTLTDSLVNIDCFGTSLGEISLQITGGAYPLVYTWEKDGIPFIGGPSDTIKSSLLAGSYRLVIEDANECVDTSTFIISENSKILLNITDSVPTCSQSNGFIKVSVVSGGVFPYTYEWQPTGSTSDSVGGLQAGMYTVTVTDSLGCEYEDSIELFSPPPLSITFTNYNDSLSCYGYPTAIIANISGGTTANGNYTILWDNGDTTQQTILSGGTHQILVIDDVGCKDSATVFIYTPDSLSYSVNGIDPSCSGNDGSASVTVTGGSGNYTYVWSDLNAQTTPQAIGLVAGPYWVFVADSICGSATLAIILDPYISTLDIDNASLTDPSSCADDDGEINVTVSGGFPPYTYSCSPGGQTINPFTGLGFGSYTVLVTDSCGLTTTATYTLNQYISILNIDSVNLTQPSCSDDDGEIDITVISGGLSPYTYLLDNVTVNNPIMGLGFGNYTVSVTDFCGFTTTATYTLNQQQNTILTTKFSKSSLWSGVKVTGSNPPFSVDWNSISMTGDSIQGLCAGNYPITVTDSKNCEDTLSVNVNFDNIQLADSSTSTVIDTSWGMGPFTYSWNTNPVQTTPHADSLCEGTHTVTVTAWGGPLPLACHLTDSFTINALEVILDPAVAIVDCEDDFDGTITVTPDGGTPNYRYLWSTGDTSKIIKDNLNPETYYVSIFDKNGCQLDTSIIISALGPDCITNVFSPNGDGTNDTWQWNKDQSGDSFLYSESTVTIYGRYGRKMYESVGYDTPWDGKNKKRNPVPDGTYFYVITLKDGAEPIRGTVTIIR